MRIRRTRIVVWNCNTCGYNGVEIRKTVKNMVSFCACCNQEVVIKDRFPTNNSVVENCDRFIQKIALGWG